MITIEAPESIVGPNLSAIRRPAIARFMARAQEAAGLTGEVHVLLADDATLKRLNRAFRGKNKSTDVLSFPAGASTVFFSEPGQPELAGDLAVSLETAARQAFRFGHTLSEEVRILLLHGVLHLAGYDHEKDSGEMAAREAELRQQMGLPVGLIARTAKPAAREEAAPVKPGIVRRKRA